MKRLTEYTVDSFGVRRTCLTEPTKKGICTDCEGDCDTCSFKLAVEKLAAYEDTDDEARSSIRVSFSIFTTSEEIREAAIVIADSVKKLQRR